METHSADYQAARQRAEDKIGFYIHAIVYVAVNAMLVTLDLTGSPDKLWFYWPLGGWGIGLALHALKVYGSHNSGKPSWKEKMIEREMAREKH